MTHRRVVVDTNVILAGLDGEYSAASRVVKLIETRQVVALFSRELIREYRRVLLHPAMTKRLRGLTPERVDQFLGLLRYNGERINPKSALVFRRDPTDQVILRLAVSGNATAIVTVDRDLLDIAAGARRRRQSSMRSLRLLSVLTPPQFLREVEPS